VGLSPQGEAAVKTHHGEAFMEKEGEEGQTPLGDLLVGTAGYMYPHW
jgi:hypothetical protein